MCGLKRWDICHDEHNNARMDEKEGGNYVLFANCDLIKAEREALKEEVASLTSQNKQILKEYRYLMNEYAELLDYYKKLKEEL